MKLERELRLSAQSILFTNKTKTSSTGLAGPPSPTRFAGEGKRESCGSLRKVSSVRINAKAPNGRTTHSVLYCIKKRPQQGGRFYFLGDEIT